MDNAKLPGLALFKINKTKRAKGLTSCSGLKNKR